LKMSRAAHATPLTSRHPCSGAVLRPPAPRQRVPSLRARPRTDAEVRAGHRRTTPANRLHLGSLIDSRRGRGREVRCLAAGDLRLHPPLSPSRVRRKLRAEQPRKVGSELLGSGEFSRCFEAVITLLPRPRILGSTAGGDSSGHGWLRVSALPCFLPQDCRVPAPAEKWFGGGPARSSRPLRAPGGRAFSGPTVKPGRQRRSRRCSQPRTGHRPKDVFAATTGRQLGTNDPRGTGLRHVYRDRPVPLRSLGT
jgi:hypothetical protein